MVPSNLVALVVFLLLVIPGIHFELLWRRTRPRRDESVFVEISRVLLAGAGLFAAAVTTLATLEALVPGSLVDAAALLRMGRRYVTREPTLVLVTIVALPTLAMLYGIAVHDVMSSVRADARRFEHETLWHSVFSRLVRRGTRPYLSVELKDGSVVTGFLVGYPDESDPAKRELVLGPPIAMRRRGAGAATTRLPDHWRLLILSGSEIANIAVAYVGVPDAEPAVPAWRRAFHWARSHAWQTALASAVLLHLCLLTIALARTWLV